MKEFHSSGKFYSRDCLGSICNINFGNSLQLVAKLQQEMENDDDFRGKIMADIEDIVGELA